jgi:hypothetical protein
MYVIQPQSFLLPFIEKLTLSCRRFCLHPDQSVWTLIFIRYKFFRERSEPAGKAGEKHSVPSPNNSASSLRYLVLSLNHLLPSLNNLFSSLNHLFPSVNNSASSLRYLAPSLNHLIPSLNNLVTSLNHSNLNFKEKTSNPKS